jgi:hypothetical protein
VRAAAGIALTAALVVVLLPASPAGADVRRGIGDMNASPAAAHTLDAFPAGAEALDVVITGAGTAYVCGQGSTAATALDGFLWKITPSGPAWHKLWNGKQNLNDAFYNVAVGPGGVVYTAGATRTAADNRDILLVKWSPAGKRLWARRYAGPVRGNDTATDVVVDRNGNVTVCGESLGKRGLAFTVVSWNAKGERRWVRRIEGGFGSSDDRANGMVVDKAGNLYVTGYTAGDLGRAAYTVKLSPRGRTLWARMVDGPDGAEAVAITPRRAGGVYVCGRQLDGGEGVFMGLVVRYTAAGKRREFAPPVTGDDVEFNSVVETPTGKVALAGRRVPAIPGTAKRYFVTYGAADGALGLQVTYGSPHREWLAAVAADAFGGVYMTGVRAVTDAHSVIRTERYPTLSGGAEWIGDYGTTAVGANEPEAIATWKTTVWVVGKTVGPGGRIVPVAIKYLY